MTTPIYQLDRHLLGQDYDYKNGLSHEEPGYQHRLNHTPSFSPPRQFSNGNSPRIGQKRSYTAYGRSPSPSYYSNPGLTPTYSPPPPFHHQHRQFSPSPAPLSRFYSRSPNPNSLPRTSMSPSPDPNSLPRTSMSPSHEPPEDFWKWYLRPSETQQDGYVGFQYSPPATPMTPPFP